MNITPLTIAQVKEDHIPFGQFYGTVRYRKATASELTKSFVGNLCHDIITEFEARGVSVAERSVQDEIDSIRDLLFKLIDEWLKNRKKMKCERLEEVFQEYNNETTDAYAVHSKNHLLYVRPCQLSYDEGRFHIEFND